MRGLNCGSGPKKGPYLTAYEIALRHGFVGTEEQWIRSIGTMRSIHVTEESGGTFECDASLGQVRQMMEDGFIPVLITVEGLPAFLSDAADDYLAFSTQVIRHTDGDEYDLYILSRENTVETVPVSGSGSGGAIGPGSVTYAMLHANVRAALDKADSAYQKPTEGIPDTDMTEAVRASLEKADNSIQRTLAGIPADDLTAAVQASLAKADTAAQPGDLAGLVRKDAQATKTSGMTQRVGIDTEGHLWVLPQGEGEGSETVDSVEFISMTDSGGELSVNKTSEDIYEILDEGAKKLVLIDYAGRQCDLMKKPISTGSGGYSDAKFWTYDDLNAQLILYAINSSGVVSDDTVDITGFYTVPSGGIPSTDMSSAVQASLGKADSAIQSHQSLTGLVPRNQQATKTVDHTQEVTIDADGKLWVLAASSGGGSSNTELVTMTASGTDLTASKTSAQIYTILSGGAKNIVMIDYAGRQCVLIKEPIYSNNAYTDAAFWTFDELYSNLVFYTVNSSGVVSSSTLPVTGFYTKPSGGIPATDLASAVQTSLGKADTAYQKPSGGVPKTDLASAVQTSLGKADTAYQKLLTGIPQDDLNKETVAISGGSGNYYSAKSASQIYAAVDGGAVIEPVLWPNADDEYAGVTLSVTETEAVFAFIDVSTANDPILRIMKVTDSNYDTALTVESYRQVPPSASGDSGKYLKVNSSGSPEWGSAPSGTLPASTSSDSGKVLKVNSSGSPEWGSAPSGSGAEVFNVTIAYSNSAYSSDKSPSEIAAAKSGGDVIEVDCSGVDGWISYVDSNYAIACCISDSGTDSYLEIYNIASDKSVTRKYLLIGDAQNAGTISKTSMQMGNGSVQAAANKIITVPANDPISAFTLLGNTSSNQQSIVSFTPGLCCEIRLTVGSSAISDASWPDNAEFLDGWNGNFKANYKYKILIDDEGGVLHTEQAVSA